MEGSTSAVPWRVAIITSVPVVAQNHVKMVRGLGHEAVAVIVARRRAPGAPATPFAAEHVSDAPEEVDVLFAATKDSLARLLRGCELDLAISAGFPWRIPAEAIEVPRLGIVNAHPSLLPRYRGPFPVAWAVRNGEREIGLTYHVMDADFDTGNVLAQAAIPLADDETDESLYAKFPAVGAKLLETVFDRLARGDRGDVQEGGEYHSHFEEAYRRIDPSQPAAEVHLQVRAWSFVPPGLRGDAPILARDGGRVRVLRSSLTEVAGADRLECADGPLWLVETTPA
jgi:methionyl-tRNA formyltransferase